MTAEKKDRKPLRIKNLADLKRHIRLGTELVATAHQYHPDIVGLTRVVTKVQTNGFYSKIKDQPDHKWSTCNHGLGFWSPFNKAGAYRFTDSTVQVLNTRKNDGSILYEMELYDGEQSMSEQNKEVPDMNEWDRLHRQAQRYKEAYPPGTRIMLLGMGNDPNPVESGTRGTVRVVDDIGTLHCDFDNGRSLGVVPGEDSFRKLTDEELAEEQYVDMDEDESGPVMGSPHVYRGEQPSCNHQQRDVQSGSGGTEQTKSPISAITEDGDYRLRQVFQVRADRRSDLRRMRKPV